MTILLFLVYRLVFVDLREYCFANMQFMRKIGMNGLLRWSGEYNYIF